ncbi:MAG: hypothetical protein JWR50_2355 [Mucilaginibacter sp.]|nr:hypothetical protein [Mucilaginibacter sp.]
MITFPLKTIKKVSSIINPDQSNFGRNWKMFPNKQYASDLIYKTLLDDKPAMIARLGSTEALCVTNYLGVKYPEKFKNASTYIKGQTPPWWWESSTISQMQKWSGFFPGDIDKVEAFCELMLDDLENIDILGSWLKEEIFFKEQLANAKQVMLEDLEPFFVNRPWTAALENKKVLVVHPFEETIRHQFLVKDKLFDNNLLPDFELLTIKAVQTIAGEKSNFNDWFAALEHMKQEISVKDYDICILGCGAYGLPLASFVKSCGKKAIHLGGATQLIFGIKGKRWETFIVYPYENLYNDFWVRPGDLNRPKNAHLVEDACYW